MRVHNVRFPILSLSTPRLAKPMSWKIEQPGGDALGPFRRTLSKRVTLSAARATDKAARLTRDDIRTTMRAQRLGGLSRTIASTSDLQKGRINAADLSRLDVGGFVSIRGVKSPRTAGALQSYLDQDVTNIAPVRGQWLAFPTTSIPKKVGRRKITPALYRAGGLEQKIGPLQFVKSGRPAVAYLVVNDVTIRTGGKRLNPRKLPKRGTASKGRAHVSIIAFVLVRATRRSRRADPRQIAEKWARRLPALLNQELSGSSTTF